MFDSRWVRSPRVLVVFACLVLYLFIYLQLGLLPDPSNQTQNEPLNDLKPKVVAEIRDLERRRYESQLNFERIKAQVLEEENQLKTLRQQVNEARGQLVAREKELTQLASIAHPPVAPPKQVLAPDVEPISRSSSGGGVCGGGANALDSCFDQSRCPLTSGFAVFFIEPRDPRLRAIIDKLRDRVLSVTNPNLACVWVQAQTKLSDIDKTYWHGDGRNNLILLTECETVTDVDKAIIAGPNLAQARFNFDFSFPYSSSIPTDRDVWEIAPPMLPLKRNIILNFVSGRDASTPGELTLMIEKLKENENYLIEQGCRTLDSDDSQFDNYGWPRCDTAAVRLEQLAHATFTLVPVRDELSCIGPRLSEALLSGSIPIIVTYSGSLVLDYLSGGSINWKKATIQISYARLPELPFMISSLTPDHIFHLRRQGRFLYEEYFSTLDKAYQMVFSSLRNRIGLPVHPYGQVSLTRHHIMQYYPPPINPDPNFLDEDTKEEFVALQSYPRLASPSYRANFSFHYSSYFDEIGSFGTRLPDFRADSYPLPSEAKFHDAQLNFDPVFGGAGGDGAEYQRALGGNYPREQFTVVMITYKREDVLLKSLARLLNQPNLHKVVVVWNTPTPPEANFRWPDIGIPIEVVIPPRNSLNNRFLPLDNIETEAILSLDDDTHLRRDEIEFAFRTWREHRTQIVGFPGRFHSWTGDEWSYNSDYVCELSMVLTGAAFFHKQYTYLYSYWQPQAIRELVDDAINCEDIALNFLVSHVTRKPPVKVTSRWTFRCQGCGEALSQTDGHFQERHECIRQLTKIWGYNPLLYTQYRVDSILFKTRLPHDKQKCYKFI